MYAHTHLFDETVSAFKNADEETILAVVKSGAAAIAHSPYDNEVKIELLLLCPRYAFAGKRALSAKQKRAIDAALGKAYTGDIDSLYSEVCEPIDSSTWDVFESIGKIYCDTAVGILQYILGFIYIDGELDEEQEEFLHKCFGFALVAYAMKHSEDDDSEPFAELSGLDAEIAEFFDEDDPLLSFEEVCKQFPDADKADVKKSLDYLVEEGILYIADTAVGKLYARTN